MSNLCICPGRAHKCLKSNGLHERRRVDLEAVALLGHGADGVGELRMVAEDAAEVRLLEHEEIAVARGLHVGVARAREEHAHLAEEVTAGKITQAQADERLSGAADRITARVNGEKPERPADAPADAPADTTTTEG